MERPRAEQPSATTPPRGTPPTSRGPAPALPLREPPAARGSADRPVSGPPQLSLGSQIFARGVKDARMAVMGPLATNVRRDIQRRSAASAPAGPGTLPVVGAPLTMGLARSASLHTSVLPQARVQREDEPNRQPQNQLVPVTAPTGTLPLAPPGPAPVNPNQGATAPTTSTALVPSRPAPSLPLAPVIARDGGNGNGTLTTTEETDTGGDLDDLLSSLEDDSADDEEDEKGFDLDDLADKLLPYIKRLMAVERQRDEPI